MKKFAVLLAVFCLTFAASAAEVYRSLNASQLCSIMRSQGYSAELNKDSDILWKYDGIKCFIYFENGNNKEDRFFFSCTYSFDKNDKKLVNALLLSNVFNREKIIGKSFLGKNNDAIILNLPLVLEGGVTRERIIDWLDDCMLLLKVWKGEVVDKI